MKQHRLPKVITSEVELFQFIMDQSKLALNGCRIWPHGTVRGGYGKVRFMGKRLTISRFVCEITHGKMPRRFDAAHSCDNPRCVEPSHIRPLTRSENNREAWEKGRRLRHIKTISPGRKITFEEWARGGPMSKK